MVNVDLMQFCAKEKYRQNLKFPFTKDGYTWATNGHVIVRVAKRDDVKESDFSPDVVFVFSHYKNGGMVKLDTTSLPPVTFNKSDCECCHGRGTGHDCDDCTHICEECDGAGKLSSSSDDTACVLIGKVNFAMGYIRQLGKLPGIQIYAKPMSLEPCSFKFDGGKGLIMPLSSKRTTQVVLL